MQDIPYKGRPLAPYDIVDTPDNGRAVVMEIHNRRVKLVFITKELGEYGYYPLEALRRTGRLGGRAVEKYVPHIEKLKGSALLCQYGVKADEFMSHQYSPGDDGLTDVLADLLHYARRYRLDFRKALAEGRKHFSTEAAQLPPMGVAK